MPSRMPTSACPCDSPAVRKRSIGFVLYTNFLRDPRGSRAAMAGRFRAIRAGNRGSRRRAARAPRVVRLLHRSGRVAPGSAQADDELTRHATRGRAVRARERRPVARPGHWRSGVPARVARARARSSCQMARARGGALRSLASASGDADRFRGAAGRAAVRSAARGGRAGRRIARGAEPRVRRGARVPPCARPVGGPRGSAPCARGGRASGSDVRRPDRLANRAAFGRARRVRRAAARPRRRAPSAARGARVGDRFAGVS